MRIGLWLSALAATAAQYAAAAQGLTLQLWQNNTAFSPPAAANTLVVPGVNVTAANGIADFSSLRFTATLTAATTDLYTFSIVTDGSVLLWVDDHLTIDALMGEGYNLRTVTAFLNMPLTAGVGVPLRLEYVHYSNGSGGPATAQLYWQGNTTAHGPVPTAVFNPTLSGPQQQRMALRDRMQNPAVAWQTFNNPTMGTHVQMPSSFAVDATLANARTNATLGDIIVFRQANPAITYVGGHSVNGSDFTQLQLDRWQGAACTVLLQTTVVNAGQDLQFLATSNGTDCKDLLLLLTPKMLFGRVGTFNLSADGRTITASMPGFPAVTVYTLGAAPVPFAKADAFGIALPLDPSGTGSGIVGYTTGTLAAIPDIQAAIAAAAVRHATYLAQFGPELQPVFEPLASVVGWNTIYSTYEGVVTPVSRGWDFGSGYVLFDWDNFFLSYMSATFDLDIGISNVIQTTLMRTLTGFVPNWQSGPKGSYDRTEPQLGALVLLKMYNKHPAETAWVVELLFDALYGWQDWVWRRRRGEGVLAGADGQADLIVLGTDPCSPASDHYTNTLAGSRLESGLDNSPQYDGEDITPGAPVTYNTTTHHMELYDVGMTGLYLSDTAALIELAPVAGRSDVIPLLQQRYAAVASALNSSLWEEGAGMYTNMLFNGTFYPRYAPTSFFPMISGLPSAAQADAAMRFAASPEGFCLNTSYNVAPNGAMLSQWWDGKHDNAGCISGDCLKDIVNDRYKWVRIEAVTLLPSEPAAPGLVPLALWYSASRDDYALTNSTTAPPDAQGGYVLVRQEGWCWSSPPASALTPGWPTNNLTLWWSSERKDYQTCGSAGCLFDTASNKYAYMGQLCYAYNGTGPLNWPCQFGGNSIARSDAAFLDNTYWRGRIWGPHLQLLYWSFSNPSYDAVPSVQAVRKSLVAQGSALSLQAWSLYRQVCENYNGLLGVCEDMGDADPFYHWGALGGFLQFQEAGLA